MSQTDMPIGVAVIGAGRWGPNLIRNFHEHRSSTVEWVIDRVPERREQVSLRFPEIKVADDPAIALSDPRVDAVVIATPATTHAEFALAAIHAGKHVFVEKPLAPSLEEARRICAAADEAGVILAVGHVFLYNPAIRRIKQYLADETIGNVRYISMVRTNLGPPGIDVNVAWDLATHDISIANYWLNATALTAAASGGSWITSDREDTVFATLRYPSGCLVHLNSSWLNPIKTRAITVVGDRKMATVDDILIDEPIRLYDKGIDQEANEFIDTFGAFRSTVRDGDVTIPRVPTAEPLREECAAFIDAIHSGVEPIADGRSALPVIATVEAINRSLRNHGAEEQVLA